MQTATATRASPSAADRLLGVVSELLDETRPSARDRTDVRLDSRLDNDLGLDSLTRVELLARLERSFDVQLPDRLIGEANTVNDLLRALDRGKPFAGASADLQRTEPVPQRIARVPDAAVTLLDVLDWHVDRHAERQHNVLLESGSSQPLTYGDLAQRAERVAAGLQEAGLEPRQPVGLLLPTSQAFFVAFIGILRAGGIPVPMYPPFRWTQIEDHLRRQAGILGNCEAPLLITVPEVKPAAAHLRATVAALRAVMTVDELQASNAALSAPRLSADDIAMLQYTSGSTGSPKGVVLTHAHLRANLAAMRDAVDAQSSDVFVSWLPLYHDMGLIGAWLGSLIYAMRFVVMSPLHFLGRPARWLQAIHRHRGTLSAGPNFAFELCVDKIREREIEGIDLSCWRWAFNGAEPVSAATLQRFADRYEPYGFDRRALAPVYGLAEVGLGITFPPPRRGPKIDLVEREALARNGRARPARSAGPDTASLVACGRVLPGYELRIVDRAGRERDEREEGRVQMRGPSITSGYYRNPEETRKLFDGDWLDSGDLGYLADGELYVTGRAKDLIIRGGHNVHPNALEQAIGDIDGVRTGCVAAFGVRDETSGTERVVIVAETRARDAAQRSELAGNVNAICQELIGGPADDVVLVPPHTVLKTSSGKIRRAANRQLYLEQALGRGRRAVWLQLASLALNDAVGRARGALRAATAFVWAAYVWSLVAGLGSIAALLLVVVPQQRARRHATRALARALLSMSGLPIAVRGAPWASGTAVFVANHASYIDGILLYAHLPADATFAAKDELAASPIGWLLRRTGSVTFVERFDVQRGAMQAQQLTETARRGQSLVIFPEGGFRRQPGLQTFRMGAFVASAQSERPLQPIALRGTRAVLRAERWFPRRTQVTMTVSPPLQPRGTDWTAAIGLRDAARAALLEGSGEADVAR